MSKFNQIKYVNEYNISHYDRINLLTPRGLKSKIKAHAAARGESVNAFISRAAAAQIERDRAEDERRAAEPATPPTATASEPETAEAEQRTGQRTEDAAQAPAEDNDPTEISTTGSTAEPEQDSRTTTAPKSTRRGRPPKQSDPDPAQLTLDDTADSGRG